jgi:predicted transcriptional regulator with HTH domain
MQVDIHLYMQVYHHIGDKLLKGLCISFFVDGMQVGENVITPETLRPLVMRSLRRSSVRKKIAEYLFEISPSGSYTSDIAYNVKTTPTNVIGAIRGMNSRYRDDESLIGLNLVELVESSKNVKIYKITDFGKEIVQSMKERR